MRESHVLLFMNFLEECFVMRSLKYLAAAAAVAMCSPAFAQDMGSDSTRIISDPLYLPLQGEFFGSTAY